MTNKTTKRALLSSVMALFLCFTMLIGTTYAWFTDSVSSANNIIKSGNLDVNLYYWDNSMEGGTKVSVSDDPALKLLKNAGGEEILWEPGASGFGQFEVVNEGTLALKYELVLTFDNATETLDGKTLGDVLSVYAMVRNFSTGADDKMEDVRLEELRNLYMDAFVPGYEAQALTDFALEGYLLPGESVKYELGVFWEPSVNDNDYNVEGGLSIDFGVTLLATQHTYEEDSNDDQYDEEAAMMDVILAHGGVIDLGENFDENMTVSSDADVTVNLNGHALTQTLTNNGAVTLNTGNVDFAGRWFTNNGTATLNDIVMNSGSASAYANVTAGADAHTTYNNVQLGAAGGGIAVSDGASVVFNSGSVAINSTQTSQRYNFYASGEGTEVTINGGSFSFEAYRQRSYICALGGATVYVTGGDFGVAPNHTRWKTPIYVDDSSQVIITGGTFGFDPTEWVAEGYCVEESNGIYTVKAIGA